MTGPAGGATGGGMIAGETGAGGIPAQDGEGSASGTSAGGVPAQGGDAAADAALGRVAQPGAPDAEGGRDPAHADEPTTEGESWRAGTHYLGQVAVDMGDVTAIDVVAAGLDDEYQEAGVLAKVRTLVDTTIELDALEEPMAEALPADEHGAFRGEIMRPEDGRPTAEIRVTHEHGAGDSTS